jgi:WD40 repeat protein
VACAVTSVGRRLVSAWADGGIAVWAADTGAEVAAARVPARVAGCALSPDDAWLAVACADGTVRLLELEALREKEILTGHEKGATAVAFAPNGYRLVSGGGDGRFRIREVASGRESWFEAHHRIGACAFSPDGGSVLIGEWNGDLRIHDTWTGALWKRIEHVPDMNPRNARWIRVAAYSPDGDAIAVSAFGIPGGDSAPRPALVLHDASTGTAERALTGHAGWLTGCAFSPDGRRLATSAEDQTAMVWDASSGEVLGVFEHPASVHACAWTPDGAALVTASADGELRLWDVETGIAATRERPAVRPVDVGVEILVKAAFQGRDPRRAAAVNGIALSSDGSVAASVSFERAARIWDVASGVCGGTLELGGSGLTCSLSPDGTRLATCEDPGTHRAEGLLRLWDVGCHAQLNSLRGYPTGVRGGGSANAVAFSPDGSRLAAPAESYQVAILAAENGEQVALLPAHTDHVLALMWSPDGQRLVSASADGRVLSWKEPLDRPPSVVAEHVARVHRCAFSADGSILASASVDGSVVLTELATRRVLFSVISLSGVAWCGFTPDSSTLVIAGYDGSLRLRAGPRWDERLAVQAHAGSTRACALHPHGRHALSAGDDGWLKVWDLESGEEAAARFVGGEVELAMSADGRVVAVGGGDGSVRFLSLESVDPPSRAGGVTA